MSAPHYTPAVRPAILVVDDYVDALSAWEVFLGAEGFEVLTASNGADALAVALLTVPDLVVMDLALGSVSGCDVARALRSEARTQRIPLIAATGFSDKARLQQAREAGFDVILVKPVDPTELAMKIRELLASAAGHSPMPE